MDSLRDCFAFSVGGGVLGADLDALEPSEPAVSADEGLALEGTSCALRFADCLSRFFTFAGRCEGDGMDDESVADVCDVVSAPFWGEDRGVCNWGVGSTGGIS